jgi:hypothetical protein
MMLRCNRYFLTTYYWLFFRNIYSHIVLAPLELYTWNLLPRALEFSVLDLACNLVAKNK